LTDDDERRRRWCCPLATADKGRTDCRKASINAQAALPYLGVQAG